MGCSTHGAAVTFTRRKREPGVPTSTLSRTFSRRYCHKERTLLYTQPMPSLTLRASHKAVTAYYESLTVFAKLGATHELAMLITE